MSLHKNEPQIRTTSAYTESSLSLLQRLSSPRFWASAGLVLTAVAVACSTSDSTGNGADPSSPDEPQQAQGGYAGRTKKRPSTMGPSLQVGTGGTGSTSDTAASGSGPTCAGVTQKAVQIPLDMYIMMDQSGSMSEKTGVTDVSKWQAIKKALTSFLEDPSSSGLGVGIQYFPLLKANVPATCNTDSDCNGFGPCDQPRACKNASISQGVIVPCATSADCNTSFLSFLGFSSDVCIPLGQCSANSNVACFPDRSWYCGDGEGTCEVISTCHHRDSCDLGDYAKPEVEISALPGGQNAIISSLNHHDPLTQTPTAPALQGAITYTSAWAKSHPERAVVTVLATDGLPNECPDQDESDPRGTTAAAAIAQAAVGSTPSIRTFVIGIFNELDQKSGADQNLNTISRAGNGSDAIIVQTKADVTKQFQDALNRVRNQALPCAYQLPTGTNGTPDYSKVNVQFASGDGQQSTIYYVSNAAQCDPTNGGWYYDKDPLMGGIPNKIRVCNATCNAFKADSKGEVAIEVGCQTRAISLK